MPDDAGVFKGIFVSKLWPGHPSNDKPLHERKPHFRMPSVEAAMPTGADESPFPMPGVMNGYPLDPDEQAAVDRVANG